MDPANALQSLVSRLRRALGDAASRQEVAAGNALFRTFAAVRDDVLRAGRRPCGGP